MAFSTLLGEIQNSDYGLVEGMPGQAGKSNPAGKCANPRRHQGGDLGLEGIVSKKADSPYRSGRQGSNPSAG
jgi:hypothetical protein